MQRNRAGAGATLLEVLVAMLIIGLVATGIVTAFIFSRRVSWRSGTELSGAGFVNETGEALRGAVGGTITSGPNAGLSLVPGVYVDEHMSANGGNVPEGAVAVLGLNLPDYFQKFLTNTGSAGATIAAANHADGRMVVVEDTGQDLDLDGQSGLDLNGDGRTDLLRVRIRMKWTSPSA